MTDTPDWIKPGTKVLIYNPQSRDAASRHLTVALVAKVATQSFTVDNAREPRFKLKNQEARVGEGWGAFVRRVVPIDSEEAKREIEDLRLHRQRYKARAAVDEWQRKRTRETRLAAIEALEAVEVDE